MTARHDLGALDDDKLVALANRGLVKRARKELDRGEAPTIEVEEDGTVVAERDGVVTRLEPGRALRDTRCTCGALKVCRHRLLAVMAYRERATDGEAPPDEAAVDEGWSPASFTDEQLEALLGRYAWARAKRRRAQSLVAHVVSPPEADVPTVELPTCAVRFLVPGAPSYARCDCEAGVECMHIALAVWAFREADARAPGAARSTVEIGGAEDLSLAPLDAARELASALILDGAAGSGAALGVRFARAKKPLDEAKMVWPRGICEELEEALLRYAGRDARYHPTRIGALLGELEARGRAARGDGELPARAVLGTDEPTETKLEHLRLVSLGARLEAIGGDARRVRASVFLADPDGGAVVVLHKTWTLGDGEPAGAALARRSVAPRVPLGSLARGQVVTRAARRRANRLLVLGQSGVGRTSVTPQRGEWSTLPAPLYVERVAELDAALRARAPEMVRPRRLADRVHVFPIHAVLEVGYSAADQTARARLVDPAGDTLLVELEHSSAAPTALDALVAALTGDAAPRYVSGEVSRRGEAWVMTPLAVVTDRVIALDLDEPGEVALPPALGAALAAPLHDALVRARDALDLGAHLGLRHVGASWREELTAAAARLEAVGMTTTGARTRAVLERLGATRGADLDAEQGLAAAWLDATVRVRLALERV